MQTILKIGGLAFSSGLTLSLFGRLFGLTPFGIFMAVAALALFEGGAFGWARLLKKGREAQRVVAGTCLVISVGLSLFSSGAEIILATRLGAAALAQLDFEFLTLLCIVVALATNVIGALAFDAMKPETRRAAQKMAFEGRLAAMNYKAQNQIMDAAEMDADLRVETRAPQLALLISDRALEDTQRAVMALSTAGRDNVAQPAQLAAPAPVALPIAQPAQDADANMLAQWWGAVKSNLGRAAASVAHAPTQAAHAVGGGQSAQLEHWQEDEQPAPVTAIGPLPGMPRPAAEAKIPAPKVKAKPGRKPGPKTRAKVG